ncbi:hypothetical protein JCM8115_006577 [Rhodotorula mucilaginosa]
MARRSKQLALLLDKDAPLLCPVRPLLALLHHVDAFAQACSPGDIFQVLDILPQGQVVVLKIKEEALKQFLIRRLKPVPAKGRGLLKIAGARAGFPERLLPTMIRRQAANALNVQSVTDCDLKHALGHTLRSSIFDSYKNYSSQVHLQALITGAVENRGAARKAALNSPEYVAAVARFDQARARFAEAGLTRQQAKILCAPELLELNAVASHRTRVLKDSLKHAHYAAVRDAVDQAEADSFQRALEFSTTVEAPLLSGNDTVTDVDGCTDGARAVEALVQLPDNAITRGNLDQPVDELLGLGSGNSAVDAANANFMTDETIDADDSAVRAAVEGDESARCGAEPAKKITVSELRPHELLARLLSARQTLAEPMSNPEIVTAMADYQFVPIAHADGYPGKDALADSSCAVCGLKPNASVASWHQHSCTAKEQLTAYGDDPLFQPKPCPCGRCALSSNGGGEHKVRDLPANTISAHLNRAIRETLAASPTTTCILSCDNTLAAHIEEAHEIPVADLVEVTRVPTLNSLIKARLQYCFYCQDWLHGRTEIREHSKAHSADVANALVTDSTVASVVLFKSVAVCPAVCIFCVYDENKLLVQWDVDKPMAEHVGRVHLQHLVEAQSALAGAIPVPRCPCATCPGVVFPPLVEFVNYLIGVHHVPLARVASRAAGDVDNILAAWDGNPATLAYSVKRKVGVKADKKRAAKRRVGNGNEEEADNERSLLSQPKPNKMSATQTPASTPAYGRAKQQGAQTPPAAAAATSTSGSPETAGVSATSASGPGDSTPANGSGPSNVANPPATPRTAVQSTPTGARAPPSQFLSGTVPLGGWRENEPNSAH